ncbi:MAG: abortive infection system antitoxin AbiGi family protein [Pseudobdellovibrionaceae bacterium]
MKSPRKLNPINRYLPQTHISDILWHFIGPKEFEGNDYTKALVRLESYIRDDLSGIDLVPFKKISQFHVRTLLIKELGYGVAEDLGDVKKFVVHEPRALCFCDIPISSLPVHMAKYGDIGIGIHRRKMNDPVFFNKLRPVLYYPHINSQVIHDEQNLNRFWKIEGSTITLHDFVKIPTHLSSEQNANREFNAEQFETIYEEREWRSMSSLRLSLDDIAYFIIPEKSHLSNHPKIKKLIAEGIGLITAKDMYRLNMSEGTV